VGGAVEIAAIACAAFYAYLLKDNRTALALAACSTAFLVIAFIVWLSITAPVNAQVLRWNPDAIPAGWETLRTRWEYSHTIRFIIHLIAALALIGAALIGAKCANARPVHQYLRWARPISRIPQIDGHVLFCSRGLLDSRP
jgi:hypothetical protein